MALISLEEAKTYLRWDSDDEEILIQQMSESAEQLVLDTARVTAEDLAESDDDARAVTLKAAAYYALGYLNEHREEADHHALMLDLRALLFGVREAAF